MDLDAPETLSMWSHEVRNPVASMVLSAHALRNRLRASHELVEIADRIVLAGNRAITILESAMECGTRTGLPEALPVRPLPALACLRESVAVQTAYADARGAALDLRLGRSLDGQALVDGRRLRHVLDNLLSNALRFAGAGRIRIGAAITADDQLVVVVRDDGPGFETTAFEAIRVRPGRPGGLLAGGWGIGLTFARKMVRDMGGELRLANAPARAPGACVMLRVPLLERAERPRRPATDKCATPAPARGAGSLRVR